MKALILALAVVFLGCASSGTGFSNSYPTLDVTNRSGATIRLFLEAKGTTMRIGRAWPGKGCFRLAFLEEGVSARFGLQHQGGNLVWGPIPHIASFGRGFALEINQPNQEIFDLQRIVPAEKC